MSIGISGGTSGAAGETGLTDTELRATPVPVEATIDTTGLATSAKQDTLLTELQLKADLTETQPVSLAAVPSHAVTNTGTFAVQVSSAPTTAVTGTFWQGTQPISAASLPLPTNAATLAGQTQPGVDIGDVTINNASGGSAVNIQDGGNIITVDGAVTTSGTVTEANSAVIAASLSVLDDWDETDRAKVNIIAGQVGIAGGTGTDSALVPRVSLATNVALPTGSNVIGHVIADTGSTTAVTQATASNLNATVVQATGTNLHTVVDSGSITAVQPTGTNLHVVVDTTSTTAVTQATGTNLHAVIDSGSITAVQPTGTNLHVVVDTTSTTAVTQATATNLNAAVVGTGTAGTAAGGVLTVQGVASMTPILATVTGTVSATSSADVQEANDDVAYIDGDLAKNLTQSPEGFLRVLIGAKVTDAEPLYIPGFVQALSLSADGRLRVASTAESFNFAAWGDPVQYSSDIDGLEEYPASAW